MRLDDLYQLVNIEALRATYGFTLESEGDGLLRATGITPLAFAEGDDLPLVRVLPLLGQVLQRRAVCDGTFVTRESGREATSPVLDLSGIVRGA